MSLTEYQALDLRADSPKASKLFKALEHEEGAGPLRLTGDGDAGALSANLTPIMSSWLNSEIAPVRSAAINSIETEAKKFLLSGGVPGIAAEIEGDKLKRHRAQRRADESVKFYRENKSTLDELAETKNDFLVMKSREGGRDPLTPSIVVDLLVIAAILIPESFMNYQSFLDYIGLGVVALGTTLVVGAGFGVSGYLAGRFWKAFHFYMPPDNRAQRQKGVRMIAIASLLLFVSLIAVGAVRYSGVMRQADELIALGQLPPNAVLQTGFLLFGNLLVFALGLALTFWLHDENPEFAAKAKKYQKQQAKLDQLRKKQLERTLNGIDEAYKQGLQKMQGQANLMPSMPGFSDVQEKIGVLNAKDNEVVALLQEYRTRLCSKISTEKLIIKESDEYIDKSLFATLPVELYRG